MKITRMILLYVDPGSGSYLIQLLIGAALAGLFFLKNLWWKIKYFFTRHRKNDLPENDEADD
jgi:hypothetical protein